MKKKNTPVELQVATNGRDSVGQVTKTWAKYADVFGSVVSLRGAAYYAAEQTANETTIELYIWYRSDIKTDDRAIIGGVTYEIATPPENLGMKNRELLLRLRVVS